MQFVGQPLRTSVKIFLLSIKKILYVYDFKNISENQRLFISGTQDENSRNTINILRKISGEKDKHTEEKF
jgi:hypothetical protein